MDPFAIVLLVGLGGLALWAWRSDRSPRGHRTDPLGLRSARQITEQREALEEEDLEQLLEATNARRRGRGLPERTRGDVEREFGRGE